MVTKHQVGLAAFVVVAALASRVFFTFSSIYGSTNVTAGIAEQHVVENHFNDDTDGTSSSDASSQICPYTGQEMRDIKLLSDKDIQSLQNGTGEAFGGDGKAGRTKWLSWSSPCFGHGIGASKPFGIRPFIRFCNNKRRLSFKHFAIMTQEEI